MAIDWELFEMKNFHTIPSIFIISLIDSAVRRERISSMLNTLSLNYEFVDAIDGRTGLDQQFEILIDRESTLVNLGREMSDAEYACALSHQFIYEKIIQLGLPGAIVLEDDSIITEEFSKFLEDCNFDDFEILQLDSTKTRVHRFGSKSIGGKYKAWRVFSECYRANAYYISNKGARFIFENSFPISRTADWPCDLRELGMYLINPRAAGHDDLDSAIQESRAKLKKFSSRIVKSLNFFERISTKKV